MLLLDCKMPVPEGTRYSRHRQNGNTYLYYRERSYRDEAGKKKHVMHCVGKIFPDPENKFGKNFECLAPNEKLFLLQGKPVPHSTQTSSQGRPRKEKILPTASERQNSVRGYSLACHSILDELGIIDLLKKHYGAKIANEIVAVSAFFSAGCPGGLSNIDDYTSENIFFTGRPITSARLEELFDEIDEASKHEFFNEWIEKCKDGNDCICYEIAFRPSGSKNLILMDSEFKEYGEDLTKEKVVIFCRVKDKMPLFYVEYDRSTNDFSNLPNVIEEARKVGLSGELTLVLGQDLAVSHILEDDNLRKLDLIFGAPLNSCVNIHDKILEWINSSLYRNETFYHDSDIYRFHESDFQIGQRKSRAIFYKSPSRQFEDERTLGKIYAKNKHELDTKKELSHEAAKRLSLLFDINRDDKDCFTYKLNQKKFAERLNLCGAFALFSTRHARSAQEILSAYMGKDVVEKSFEVLKNKELHESIPAKVDDGSRGKLFVAFVGFIARTEIEKRIRPYLDKEKFDYESAVSRLDGIKCCRDRDKWMLTEAISRKRQNLAQLLHLPLGCFVQP